MKYYLAESSNNTFLLFDSLQESNITEDFMQKARSLLEKENRDDVLILNNGYLGEDSFVLTMTVLGLDGKLGAFCGNGACATAAFLFEKFPFVKKFSLLTDKGLHALKKEENNKFSVSLPKPVKQKNSKFLTDIDLFQKKYPLFLYVEMIEPHLVYEGDMTDEELFDVGQKLNQQKQLFPFGINVNAWHKIDHQTVYVKTYERGVQRLTASCGTGSLASASCFKESGKVLVVTKGGQLNIEITPKGVVLIGQASFS